MSNGSVDPATPKNILETMTLRDLFAGMAMQGMMGAQGWAAVTSHCTHAATLAYQFADAMLQQRKATP